MLCSHTVLYLEDNFAVGICWVFVLFFILSTLLITLLSALYSISLFSVSADRPHCEMHFKYIFFVFIGTIWNNYSNLIIKWVQHVSMFVHWTGVCCNHCIPMLTLHKWCMIWPVFRLKRSNSKQNSADQCWTEKIWFVHGHIMSLFVDNQDSYIPETYAGLY